MITFGSIGYMGRLGNQMFQFASTVGIGKKLGYDIHFPLDNCYNYQNTGPIDVNTGLNIQVKCDLIDCFDISQNYFVPSSNITIKYVYSENGFKYNEESNKIPDHTNLHGYFQSEKYFLEIRDLILSQFKFKESFKKTAEDYIYNLNKTETYSIASIHIRRGDYLLYPDHHPACSKDYVESAVKRIKERSDKRIKFLVFSDDPGWCKSEFTSEEYIISSLGNPYIELCAMSICDHNIIANSSFSWWGAWLNTNKNKIVISPSRWFGKSIGHDTSDIYCTGWEII